MMYCDYLTVQGNTVFDNAYWNQWGSSGISIWEPTAYDQAAGYHMIISQNLVYNNNEFVNNVAANCITDGNGIILDSFNTADPGNNHLAYNPGANGRILVSNNVSAGNGGSGMHALNSKQIDFVNNTTWHNGQRALGPAGWTQGYSGGATIYNGSSTHPNSPSQNGELVINGCSNVNVINNICVADTGRLMNISYNDTNYVYDHNILFGGGDYLWNQGGVYTYLASSYEIPGTNTIEADPLLVNPFITRNTSSTSGISSVAVGNFSLQSGSPAIDSALASYTSPLSVVVTAPSTDILGTVRPQANGDNRGAYEFLAAPSNSTATPTMPPWVLVSLAMLLVTAGLKSLPKPAREN
jgi:hypothetical protein